MSRKVIILSVVLTTLLSCDKQKKPLTIGHRGAMGYETENTLASVQKALDLGVDMIEIDVFVIASGEVVVFHDETLERLSTVSDSIEHLNWKALQNIRLTGNHRIPLLTEVLDLIDKKVPINIELKGKNTAKPVFEIMEMYQKEKAWQKKDFFISSFLWDELSVMRKLDGEIGIGVLTEENPLEAMPFASTIKAQSINPWWKTLTKENCQQLHEAGFEIYTYTVNEPADIQTVIGFEVDGIFTNFPDRMQ
jgi:glycerophosphoryl diester phosphodiesterase